MERRPVPILSTAFLMPCHVATSSAYAHHTRVRRTRASRSSSCPAPSALSHRLAASISIPMATMARWCDLPRPVVSGCAVVWGEPPRDLGGPTWTRPRNVGPGSTWRGVQPQASRSRQQNRTARERCNNGSIGKDGMEEWQCPAPAPQWVP